MPRHGQSPRIHFCGRKEGHKVLQTRNACEKTKTWKLTVCLFSPTSGEVRRESSPGEGFWLTSGEQGFVRLSSGRLALACLVHSHRTLPLTLTGTRSGKSGWSSSLETPRSFLSELLLKSSEEDGSRRFTTLDVRFIDGNFSSYECSKRSREPWPFPFS